MKRMKKIVIGLIVMLMALTAVLTLVACSKAPGYVTNPPADPAELVAKLKADGWDVDDDTVDGIREISGFKVNLDYEDDEVFIQLLREPDKKIDFEGVTVTYYETEEEAKEALKEINENASKAPSIPGLDLEFKFSQKGNTVSGYIKANLSVREFFEAMFGESFEDLLELYKDLLELQ